MPSDIYFHIRSNAGAMAGYQDPVNQSGGSDNEATSDNAILASRLAHWISVTSHYTCV